MMRGPNPHIPYTPDEIAEDAAQCREAGAAIMHVHARLPDGGKTNSPELYAEITRKVRAKSDMLVHTTLGNIHNAGPDEKRLAHVAEAKPDMASIDIGSNNTDTYLPGEKRFKTTDHAYVNTIESCLTFARKMRELNVKPLVACWSVPFLRAVDAFLDMGEFVEPVMVNLVLCEGGIIGGHPGTTDGLSAFFHALPRSGKCEWTVCVKKGNIFSVAAMAIERGGHVSPGLGDYHYPELGYPTNAQIVRTIAGMAKAAGREVATPDEARDMLNMPRRAP
jgi:3-keto-5-aminohexanoate cleavage enzyme